MNSFCARLPNTPCAIQASTTGLASAIKLGWSSKYTCAHELISRAAYEPLLAQLSFDCVACAELCEHNGRCGDAKLGLREDFG